MNPDLLKQLMPFLAGMGFPELIANIGKMHKMMTGGGQGKNATQQPPGAQAAPPGMASPGATAPSPALLQLLQARQQGAGAVG